MRTALRQEAQQHHTVKFAKQTHIYICGDQAQNVYFIESGQVKLLMRSPEGNECLLAILTAGDIFGELCLSGLGERTETAVAMTKIVVKVMPANQFFARLCDEGLLKGFVQYLAVRLADQQGMIANLVTANSEQRLGKTLLQLARTFLFSPFQPYKNLH